jgi:hypothetical protein
MRPHARPQTGPPPPWLPLQEERAPRATLGRRPARDRPRSSATRPINAPDTLSAGLSAAPEGSALLLLFVSMKERDGPEGLGLSNRRIADRRWRRHDCWHGRAKPATKTMTVVVPTSVTPTAASTRSGTHRARRRCATTPCGAFLGAYRAGAPATGATAATRCTRRATLATPCRNARAPRRCRVPAALRNPRSLSARTW